MIKSLGGFYMWGQIKFKDELIMPFNFKSLQEKCNIIILFFFLIKDYKFIQER
jgi:hypothetical protein